MALLEVNNIVKSFGKTEVLKGISFSLEKGEVDVDGRVDSFVYTEKTSFAKKGEGLLTRLFG